jgi:serine-type D-Ala-D-Ala carboxypeptidase/endopeptidase
MNLIDVCNQIRWSRVATTLFLSGFEGCMDDREKHETSTSIRTRTLAAVASLIFIISAFPANSADDGHPAGRWVIPSDRYIRDLLASRVSGDGIGMVVGVIEPAGRRVVAIGEAGAGSALALDGNTMFQIGSVTKAFTGLLLAEMVKRGEVKLEDPAQRYLPAGIRMPERGRAITLIDLATHRSGLPSMPTNFSLEAQPNPYAAYSLGELHGFLSDYSLPRDVGAGAEYSNLGVALLGRLLARRVGLEYEALLKERILAPLGMHSTTISLTPVQQRRVASGHDRFLKPVETWELVTLPASGSLRSTANDLLTFLAANMGYVHTHLSLAMELQRSVRQPADGTQALGWGTMRVGAQEIIGHEGGKEGYRSVVVFNPRARTGIVILVNARADERPASIALHLLTGAPLEPASAVPPEPTRIKIANKVLDARAGRYSIESGEILVVARAEDHLLVDQLGSGVSPFYAATDESYFSNTANEEIRFVTDSAGNVVGLTLRIKGERKTGRRLSSPSESKALHRAVQ